MKRKLVGVLLMTAVLAMAGCANNAGDLTGKISKGTDKQEMASGYKGNADAATKEGEKETTEESDEAVENESTQEVQTTESEEQTEEINTGTEADTVTDTDTGGDAHAEETGDVQRDFKEEFELYDAQLNEAPLNLTPVIGEFFESLYEDTMPIENPEGQLYGFEDDLTAGCSVWCAIADYNEKVSASSALEAQGELSYEAGNILDRDRKDAWVEGAEGNGIGESVTITKSYDIGTDSEGYDCIFFTDLCIVNGYARDEETFKNNSRVKSLKMYFNDEYVCDLELEDTMKPQYISLSGLHLSAQNKEESTFRFEIGDVYPGDKYEDTAITGIEIRMFTKNH